MNERVLLIEDEEAIALPLTDRLRREGYLVSHATDGLAGYTQALSNPYDIILLDLMLPRKGGMDVCRDLRQQGLTTPIVMLTAKGQLTDKVLGLKLGADDYITKPFELAELLARMEALLRRSAVGSAGSAPLREFAGGVRVDLRGAVVTRDGAVVPLSAKEFQLLRYLMEHAGAVIAREELLREVWAYDSSSSTRTVDVHIGWLRQKLEQDPKRPKLIATAIGLGYKFIG